MKNTETISTKDSLISRSIGLEDLDDALDACEEYIERYGGDDPHCIDLQITHSALMTYVNTRLLRSGRLPESINTSFEGNRVRRELFGNDLPSVLINGLILDPRIKDKAKRKSAINFFNLARTLDANELYKIFHKAEKEAKSLLVNGEIRGNVENKSNQDLYDDAQIYYDAYLEDDLDGALKGFNYLKSLNPTDSYFRKALGAIYGENGDIEKEIQEFLYGLYLSRAGEPEVTCNLMNALSRIELHFLVLDIWLNYKQHARPEEDENIDREIDSIVNISKVCIMGLLSLMSQGKLSKSDIDNTGKNVFDDLEPALRPWIVNV